AGEVLDEAPDEPAGMPLSRGVDSLGTGERCRPWACVVFPPFAAPDLLAAPAPSLAPAPLEDEEPAPAADRFAVGEALEGTRTSLGAAAAGCDLLERSSSV